MNSGRIVCAVLAGLCVASVFMPSGVPSESTTRSTSPMTSLRGLMNSSWPMLAHDISHSGRSNYSTINTTNIIKWKFPTSGTVWGSSPVIDNSGIIYFADEGLYAVYPNGTLKWKYGSFNCETTPAINWDGTIYVGTSHGSANGIYAINSNGTFKWRYITGNNVESSPVIGTDGTIYCGDSNGYINALYPNGTLKWRYRTGLDIYSSPAIGTDGIVYCGSHDHKLYAINPNNGTVKWNFNTGNWVHGSPTIGIEGTVYIGSDDGFLYALNPENGSMIWKTNVGSMLAAPALDEDGTLYFGVWESAFKAVYPNGTIKWSFNLGNQNGVWGSSAAISADGSIYFGTFLNEGTGGGDIIALNLSGTEKWRSRIGSSFIWSSPAIAKDGTVYIGADNGYLCAFGPLDPNAPTAPTITGEINGKIKKTYTYTFTSTSPLDHNIFYFVDWGDGTTSSWVGPYNSGVTLTLNHSWTNKGTYIIKARANDTDNLLGPWGTLSVTMPFSYDNPAMNILERILERFPHIFPILRHILN